MTDQPTVTESAMRLLGAAQGASEEAMSLFEPTEEMNDQARDELAAMAATDRTRSVVQAIVGLTQATAAQALVLHAGNEVAIAAHNLNVQMLQAAQNQATGKALFVPGGQLPRMGG